MHYSNYNDCLRIHAIEEAIGEALEERPPCVPMKNLVQLWSLIHTVKKGFELLPELVSQPGALTLIPEEGLLNIRRRSRADED